MIPSLSTHEVTGLFLALGLLLLCARFLGEIFRHINLPSVIGEIAAGILLGPTVLGALAPELSRYLFPAAGGGAVALEGLTTIAIALFLLVAGMEVDLSAVWRQGKAAVAVGLIGMALPFAAGFAAAWTAPLWFGGQAGEMRLVTALFLATALSISALPIVAKILMELNLYRSDLGVTVISAAVLNDLFGWLVFALVLGLAGAGHGAFPIEQTVLLTLAFTAAMLTVVPYLVHRLLPWVQAYFSWPGGVIGFALVLGLFCAAFTEWLGVHAIFGAFLAGVALGQSSHLRERTRAVLDEFISYFFAPLFFASIGLKVNFIAHFDPLLTLAVLLLAASGKVTGSALGARLGGFPWREAWGVGLGMSAQGTMGIILGMLALQLELINQDLFVSLVVMALATSLLSGPAMQVVLRLKRRRRFADYTNATTFIRRLSSKSRREVIQELASAVAVTAGRDAADIAAAVWDREHIMATGLGAGVAVPHARLADLEKPVVGVGLSEAGIDFDAPDGEPARVVLLILTPAGDAGSQLEILADIGKTFQGTQMADRCLSGENYTEFLALVKSGG